MNKKNNLLERVRGNLYSLRKHAVEKNVLLAVSGGVDSIVLVDILHRLGYASGIAHCNFQLRGKESDEDEDFVKDVAIGLHLPFFSKRFETRKLATSNGVSIQMAARDIRYAWFHELCHSKPGQLLATAHHLDDSIEGFFINLFRGCGIKGLDGIPVRHEYIIRPLHNIYREEILDYATENSLSWREDSSNANTYYIRNKIRHQIIPAIELSFPDAKKQIARTMGWIGESVEFIEECVAEFLDKSSEIKEDGSIVFPISKIQRSGRHTYLFKQVLLSYGFSPGNIPAILLAQGSQSGARFESHQYILLKDRSSFILKPRTDQKQGQYKIQAGEDQIDWPIHLRWHIYGNDEEKRISADPFTACLDFQKLKFPLLLRRWKAGDRFQPLGMTSFKKLSDFFVDSKLTLFEKENCWILESDGEIVWILGQRIDNRFKVTGKSLQIIEFSCLPPEIFY